MPKKRIAAIMLPALLVCISTNAQTEVYDASTDLMPADSLHLPALNSLGQMRVRSYPTGLFGMSDWDLHCGLNVNLGVSVSAMFGKYAPKGAGFGQNVSAMYAVPLNSRLSLATGGYFNNISWAGYSLRDAGLNAILSYRFDEHWEACLYAQKSLTDSRVPLPLCDMSDMGDRIGAAVKYNVNPSFSIEMSVYKGKSREPYLCDFMRDILCR